MSHGIGELADSIRKFATIVGFAVVVLLIEAILGLRVYASDEYLLYVQEGCSHCAKVEEYIDENGLGDEITIKDVSVDEGASEEYTNFLDEQQVPLEDRGVPLLVYDGDSWLSGDQPIIDLFSERFEVESGSGESYSSEDYLLLGVGGVVIVSIIGYGIVNAVHAKKR